MCQALEKYLYEKLSAAEMTHKELQLRMADPEVAGDAQEFLRVAKAAGEAGLVKARTAFMPTKPASLAPFKQHISLP